jgi:hypothetical protein
MQTRSTSTCILLLLVMVHVWFVSGCGRDATGSADESPQHHHVVCVSTADSQTETCEVPERLALFNIWVKEAISLPHSTFSIWTVDSARQQYRHVFSACVPKTWPASVWKAKSDYIMRAQQHISGTQQGLAVTQQCRPPEPQSPGNHQLTVSPAAASLDADLLEKLASASVAPLLHLSVVCDFSSSTMDAACHETALLRAFDFWVAEGLARPGSSLSVDVVGQSRETMWTVFDLSVPERSVGERIAYMLWARAQLAQLKSESFEKNGSAIVEAIHAAVSKLRERSGWYSLVVLSDLRQLTPEWDFEHTVPKAPTFLTWLKNTHLLSDLRDINVRVCGMHNRRTPGSGSYTATRAAQLQEIWERTFRAMGATQVNLFSSCDSSFATL